MGQSVAVDIRHRDRGTGKESWSKWAISLHLVITCLVFICCACWILAGHVDGPEVSEEHPEGKTETDAEKEKRKVGEEWRH